MTVTITAETVGTSVPPAVQVVIGGLSVDDEYTVTGSAADQDWDVRAGAGVATSDQVVLVDLLTPVNTPITYTVLVNGTPLDADPLTVTFTRKYALQSLNGDITATVAALLSNGAPRDLHMRSSLFPVPGRARPVVRFDIPGGESGAFQVKTQGRAADQSLRDLLALGGLIMWRSDGDTAGLSARDYLMVTSASSVRGAPDERIWSLSYEVVDDPLPDTLVPASTWDDFDAVYTGLTWDDFDTEWTDSTWNVFDTADWATRAAT